MSRKIKFRAWDGEKMYYPGDGDTDVMVIHYDLDGKLASTDIGERDYDWGVVGYSSSWKMGSPQIMQFTGMVDKKGNEVWEGDIVKYATVFHGKPGTWYTGVIVYNEYIGTFQVSHIAWRICKRYGSQFSP